MHCGIITVSFPWLQLLEFWLCVLEDHFGCFTLAWLHLLGDLLRYHRELPCRDPCGG